MHELHTEQYPNTQVVDCRCAAHFGRNLQAVCQKMENRTADMIASSEGMPESHPAALQGAAKCVGVLYKSGIQAATLIHCACSQQWVRHQGPICRQSLIINSIHMQSLCHLKSITFTSAFRVICQTVMVSVRSIHKLADVNVSALDSRQRQTERMICVCHCCRVGQIILLAGKTIVH